MQKITFYVETTSVAVWPSISNLTSSIAYMQEYDTYLL